MSINLVPTPDPAAPITAATGYTRQNALISANEVPKLSILTLWESTGAEPLIKQGTFIRHAGNTYKVETADEVISGAPAAGINYIELTLTGSVITAAWVTTLAGYSFNQAYGGIYNGAGTPNQIIRDIVFLDGALYNRGVGFGEDFNSYRLANGNLTINILTGTIGKLNLTESAELSFILNSSPGIATNFPTAAGYPYISIEYTWTNTSGSGTNATVFLQRLVNSVWVSIEEYTIGFVAGAGSDKKATPFLYVSDPTEYRIFYAVNTGSFTGMTGKVYYKTV